MATKYTYDPLGPREIRLLKLAPGSSNSPLCYSLVTENTRTSTHGPYEALSYTWGSIIKSCTATVLQDDDQRRYRMDITPNLDTALRALRSLTAVRALWIDAICINQDDMQERESQVQMMRNIFASAVRTVVWLGDDDATTNDAIECVTLLSQKHRIAAQDKSREAAWRLGLERARFMPCVLDPFHDCFVDERRWAAFANLLARPWFERVWVYQEIAVSASISVTCGRFSLGWDDLCTACQFVHEFQLDVGSRGHELLHTSVLIMKDTRDGNSPRCEKVPTGARAPRLLLQEDSEGPEGSLKYAEIYDGGSSRPRFDINLLLLRWAQATDPRDKVYALLSISSSVSQTIRPDYTMSVSQVYTKTATSLWFIPGVSKLSFLSFVQHSDRKLLSHDLPSWVPDWRKELHAPWLINNSGFRTATAMAPKANQPNYLSPSIQITGATIMKISVVGPQAGAKAGMPPQSILNTLPNPYSSEWNETLAEALNFSEDPLGKLAPSMKCACRAPFWTWHDRVKDRVATDSPQDHGDWEVLAPPGTATPATIGSDTVEWDQLDGNVGIAYGRRVFITDLGYIGLVPLASMVGDEVCVLLGSKVPYVIRREGTQYRFVGECYVFGMMDGEVLEGIDNKDVGFLEFI